MMEDVELDIKRPATLTFTITEKVLMVTGEADIGLRPEPLPPIIQVSLVDCLVFLFMFMREVDIGFRLYTFLHITMVDYTLATQGFQEAIPRGLIGDLFQKSHQECVMCRNLL